VQIPKKLVVIGGGYIGLEFASMFRALGSEVEVFIRGPGLLRGFDKEVGLTFDQGSYGPAFAGQCAWSISPWCHVKLQLTHVNTALSAVCCVPCRLVHG
jgi:Pyridine nucleotide-disulphide oxidoreductase